MKMRVRRQIRLGQGLQHRWVYLMHGQILEDDSSLRPYQAFRCRLCGRTRWED